MTNTPVSMLVTITNRIPWLNRMNVHLKEVIRGASVAFVLKVLGAGSAFALNVILARLLGADGVGVYYLAFTLVNVAAVVGRIGLENAMLRFTASNAERGNWIGIAGVYRQGMGLAAGVSLFSSLLVISGASMIANSMFHDPALAQPLRLMGIGIIPLSLLTLHGALLQGLKKIRDAMLIQGLGVPLINVFLIILLGKQFSLVGAASAYTLSIVLVFIGSIIIWRKTTPQLRGISGFFKFRLLVSTSLPLLGVAIMNLVIGSTNTFLLSIMVGKEAVGVFNVTLRTATLTSFVLIAVNSIAAPKFASLYAAKNIHSLGKLARDASRLMIVLSLPVFVLFVSAPSWVLRLFGADFEAGSYALMILAIGQFVNVVTGSVGYLLMMCGYEKLMRNNIIFSAMINVFLSLILIPRLQVTGAAIATSVTMIIMNIVSTALVYKNLAILPLPMPKWFMHHAK